MLKLDPQIVSVALAAAERRLEMIVPCTCGDAIEVTAARNGRTILIGPIVELVSRRERRESV